MSYEQLSLNGFIKEMKEVTYGTHPRRFCFVLGAGASVASGIKSGQELVKIWDEELQERNKKEYNRWRDELSITDENMFGFYSQYYEKRYSRCPTDGYNYIEKIMENANPSAGYVMLAHLLSNTIHNVVITTNFDHLTEDAMNYYAQTTPLVIGHESLAHYVIGMPKRPTIIKIHRDLLFDPKSGTKDLEKLPDSWKNAIKLIFENYHPVFIGYAGNDKSLMDFLLDNTRNFYKGDWKYPYWLLFKNDRLDAKVERFLSESEGMCIRHEGFDEVMIQMGVKFDYAIPTEEEFLGDAKKRYKSLSDAISDALSDGSKKASKSEVISENVSKDIETTEEAEVTNQSKKQNGDEEIGLLSKRYWEVSDLYNNGNYNEALKIMYEVIAEDENNAYYNHYLARILNQLGRNDEAIEYCKKSIEIEPHDAWYQYFLGDILLECGNYDEAQEELEKAVKMDPGRAWYHSCLSEVYMEKAMYDDARKELQKAIELDPKDAWYHCCMGRLYRETNNLSKAQKSIEKAIELEPMESYYHSYLSEILREIGKVEEAQRELQKAIELKTDSI